MLIDDWGTSRPSLYESVTTTSTEHSLKVLVDSTIDLLLKHNLIMCTQKQSGNGPIFDWFQITEKGKQYKEKHVNEN